MQLPIEWRPDQGDPEQLIVLLHGWSEDGSAMVPLAALEQRGELQGDATLDIAEGIGNELHPVLIDCALHRLKTHIPLRTWQAALGAARRAAASQAHDD
jgi:phospholipase/carboxylesterase